MVFCDLKLIILITIQADTKGENMTVELQDSNAQHAIVTRDIAYQDSDGQTLVGYFAVPQHAQQLPLVLVCPEWWGRNAYIEQRTRELAQQGYAAFALDMYGDKKVADDAATANRYMSETFQNNTIIKRAMAALHTASALDEADAQRVAVIGFCYGGKVALDLARAGTDLKLVATFHGNLSTDQQAQADSFKPRVIIAHGADDSMVTLDDVEQLRTEMQQAQADCEIDIYPHAKHGFTNPKADENAAKNQVDLAYDADAAQQSFAKLYRELASVLG